MTHSKKRFLTIFGLILVFSIVLNSGWMIANWYAVSSFADFGVAWFALSFVWFLFLPLLLAPFVILGSLIGLIFKSSRGVSVWLIIASLVFMITGFTSMIIGSDIRHQALVNLTKRGQPLVMAIKNYETKNGGPPSKLEQLVPEFISSIPRTGMGAYPDYEYSSGCGTACDGNPWMIDISTPSGGINFDRFIYYPKQNYPKEGYGGVLEKIEDWAYVHE